MNPPVLSVTEKFILPQGDSLQFSAVTKKLNCLLSLAALDIIYPVPDFHPSDEAPMTIKSVCIFPCALFLLCLSACSSGGGVTSPGAGTSSASVTKVDYTAARAMNARLGRGINLGNSWDSDGQGINGDDGWSNPIEDSDFVRIKNQGFSSIRLPIRWNADALTEAPYTLDAGRVSGVLEDVNLAIASGLIVIIDLHHYDELLYALDAVSASTATAADTAAYEAEKTRFAFLWMQISQLFANYPDNMIVFDVLNEPQEASFSLLNELNSIAYGQIRTYNPGKTIIFEPVGYAKFFNLRKMVLPQDGNIIISGHYYEPYTFTHQGHDSRYPCGGTWTTTAKQIFVDFKNYADSAAKYFPDINGGRIPLNLGEFGVTGGPNSTGCTADSLPSSTERAAWISAVLTAAEAQGMSSQYWGFSKVGGFEAFDRSTETWVPAVLQALQR